MAMHGDSRNGRRPPYLIWIGSSYLFELLIFLLVPNQWAQAPWLQTLLFYESYLAPVVVNFRHCSRIPDVLSLYFGISVVLCFFRAYWWKNNQFPEHELRKITLNDLFPGKPRIKQVAWTIGAFLLFVTMCAYTFIGFGGEVARGQEVVLATVRAKYSSVCSGNIWLWVTWTMTSAAGTIGAIASISIFHMGLKWFVRFVRGQNKRA
jgi:hypothetical protein